jgi:large subunit ribosomal protein L1
MKVSKKYKMKAAKVDAAKKYEVEEAVSIVKDNCTSKFDETIEFTVRLGVDPKHADQIVRGTVVLPNGTGKKVRVLVLAGGDKAKEAQDAGADYVGAEDYIEKLQGGWLDVDTIIAVPDLMPKVGKLGKLLGPRGLMPNPKSGTVTFDIAKAVKELKSGRIEYRVDKTGNVHAAIGKASFTKEQLVENARMFMESIMRAKPSAAKGVYLRSAHVSSTMGPSVPLDTASFGRQT